MLYCINVRHDIVNFSIKEFTFAITKYFFCINIDLEHNTTIFTVELHKNNSCFFQDFATFFIKLNFLFIFNFMIDSFGLFEYFESFLFVIEHTNQILCIKIVTFNILEGFYLLPILFQTYFQREEEVGQII